MSKFTIGQLVWAKIKGYPPWPGLVSEPPSDMSASPRSKKNAHCVFFFGDDKYAWVSESDIAPYDGCKDSHDGYKNNQFKKAVNAAEDFKKKKEAEILHGKGIFKPCRVVLRDVLSNQQEVVQTFGRKENTEMIRRPEVDLQARRGDKSVLVNRRQEDRFQAHGGDENVLMNRRMVQLEDVGIGQHAALSGINGHGRPDAIDMRSHGFFEERDLRMVHAEIYPFEFSGEVSRTWMVWALVLLLGVVAADLFYYLFY